MSDTSKKQRRQRAVLSCNDCRRRKLKCDRELPCNRCKNGGIADTCAYKPEARTAADPQERPVKRQRQSVIRQTSSVVEEEPQTYADIRKSLDRSDNADISGTAKHRVEELQRNYVPLQQQQDIPRYEVEDLRLEYTRFPAQDKSDQPTTLTGLLKGRNYATFFYGSSSAMSIMAHVST